MLPCLHSKVSTLRVSEVASEFLKFSLRFDARRPAAFLSSALSFLLILSVSSFIFLTLSLYSSTRGLRSFFSQRSVLKEMQFVVISVGIVHA